MDRMYNHSGQIQLGLHFLQRMKGDPTYELQSGVLEYERVQFGVAKVGRSTLRGFSG